MGACWVPLPHHAAKIGEIMKVLWSDYYGAAVFGDEEQIACLPHRRCRVEIVATAESSHHDANLLLPGQVLHYKGTFCFLERFELPSGTTIGLWHLVGFKLRLVSDTIASVPSEDAILDRARAVSALAGRKSRGVGGVYQQARPRHQKNESMRTLRRGGPQSLISNGLSFEVDLV